MEDEPVKNELTLTNENAVALMQEMNLGSIIKPLSKEILLFDSYIAGTSHVRDESVYDGLKEDDKLVLRREDNKFDSNAILVLNEKGEKLGYIPEKDNIVFARLMDAGKLLIAKVKDMEILDGFRQIRIGIYLVDF